MLITLNTKSAIPFTFSSATRSLRHWKRRTEGWRRASHSASDGLRYWSKYDDGKQAYQILKAEGFIEIDRRRGAAVCPVKKGSADYREKLEKELELLSAEACLNGMDRKEFLTLCDRIFEQMQPA